MLVWSYDTGKNGLWSASLHSLWPIKSWNPWVWVPG